MHMCLPIEYVNKSEILNSKSGKFLAMQYLYTQSFEMMLILKLTHPSTDS
jgi:hypothetical protein